MLEGLQDADSPRMRRVNIFPGMARLAMVLGTLAMLTGVGAGAFGAHALRDVLGPEFSAVYETGVRYQLVHGLALLYVSLAAERRPGQAWKAVTWLFGLGILLFSGSLYALSLSGLRPFGAITPAGGACLLAGWVVLLGSAWRQRIPAAGSEPGGAG